MQFELTPEVIDQLIFAMENQESGFSFDTETSSVVHEPSLVRTDPARYVAIPPWGSADGFHLMERFVASLRNPLTREKLRAALASGKGVFRSFKNALKEQEGFEKLWFSFKERELKARVTDWYNDLRDSWGLGRIPIEPEGEETEELVLSDFELTLAEGHQIALIRTFDREAFFEAHTFLPRAAVEGDYQRCRRGLDLQSSDALIVSAVNPSGELAGFIWAQLQSFPDVAEADGDPGAPTRLIRVVQLYVLPEYRGLGIAKTLIDYLCGIAAEHAVRQLLIDLPGGGEVLTSHLEKAGFQPVSRALMLDVERWASEQEEE